MPVIARLQPPETNGGVLAVPSITEIPRLLEKNRASLNQAFPELRTQARRELACHGPIIVTGHQPELFHPGVWVKNFAACGLARKLGGVALNLIVDTDAVKSTRILVPRLGPPLEVEHLAFDDSPEHSYETHAIRNRDLFASFPERLMQTVHDWPFEPIGLNVWGSAGDSPQLSDRLSQMRTHCERSWGCENRELAVSAMSRFSSFREFTRILAQDAERFRNVYNRAIRAYRVSHRLRSRNHPAPELVPNELPFWAGAQRERAFAPISDDIRPRALTLTLYARLILGDFFIHGLGGGKYDAVTDAIIRDFFGIEPPSYQILTATLRLPLPRFSSSVTGDAPRLLRDLHWNPHRYLDAVAQARHDAITSWPETTRKERSRKYHAFRALAEELRPRVSELVQSSREQIAKDEARRAHNAILTRRDYAWILHPESELKPFLQQFLEPAL